MNTLILIYTLGVAVNALLGVAIVYDLRKEGSLSDVRMTLLVLAVLASFVTWAYVILYLTCSFVISLFKHKGKENGSEDDTQV